MSEEIKYAAGYDTEKNGKKVSLIPVGHHVLVLPDKVEEMTSGGLYIAPEAQKKYQGIMQIGTLVAVGPQAFRAFDDGRPWAKVGDRVVYGKNNGSKLFNYLEEKDAEGHGLRILNDEDLMMVIQEK